MRCRYAYRLLLLLLLHDLLMVNPTKSYGCASRRARRAGWGAPQVPACELQSRSEECSGAGRGAARPGATTQHASILALFVLCTLAGVLGPGGLGHRPVRPHTVLNRVGPLRRRYAEVGPVRLGGRGGAECWP